MDLFLKLKSIFFKKTDFSKFVIYKIIDEIDSNSFILQCVNSKATFKAHILEIIHDTSLLYGLHPLQSCFIGIEYAKHDVEKLSSKNYNLAEKNDTSCSDYGTYRIIYQDRKSNFIYRDIKTGEEFSENPVKIALTDNIISKFNSEQGFYIGLCAGLKIHKKTDNVLYFPSDTALIYNIRK